MRPYGRPPVAQYLGPGCRGTDGPEDEGSGAMRIRDKLRREDGAAAVEFALIVGVLAMLIFGMLQFGLAFFELQNLRAATREASRVGSVDGTVSDMQTRMQQLTGQSAASWGSSLHVEAITGGSTSQVTGATTVP